MFYILFEHLLHFLLVGVLCTIAKHFKCPMVTGVQFYCISSATGECWSTYIVLKLFKFH